MTASPQPTIHDTIRDRTELARTYAFDGAFRTAADILEDLAGALRGHANDCDRWLAIELEKRAQ